MSELDPNLAKIAQIVVEMQKCSTSLVQRQLAVGYNKAARLVEQLEEHGIVSASNEVGKRDVLAKSVPAELHMINPPIATKKVPMKNTAADDDVKAQVNTAAGEELRQFIERYERLDAEKKDIANDQKEVMAEAKGRGYDTKVIRKLIAIRKRDANDLAEEEAVMEMYMAALGM